MPNWTFTWTKNIVSASKIEIYRVPLPNDIANLIWPFTFCFCREGEMSKKALKKQQKEAEKAAKKAQKQQENKENVCFKLGD